MTVRHVVVVLICLLIVGSRGSAQTAPVSYNRDVRPILSEFCFHCHGPDSSKRKAGLDLSSSDSVREDFGGRSALVPGQPDKSELWTRIQHADPKKQMPPAVLGKRPSADQVATLRRWIEQGGGYEKHWAFIPPTRLPLPKVKDFNWIQNPLDTFVLARLEKSGLKPSPEADRVTLIRRVSLDLTGLPPTPHEVDAFVQDKSKRAYEKLVDRLLLSPRVGERLAHRWLDAARYADTNGYQTDGERVMWRWRDWVIDAFNADMPFDRFTIEQLAGDLLPNPTLDQRIATGFNRNHRGNSEGGVIPEEYAVEYVSDRVDTTSTVWLGLTMGCAKCHNHKYDPLRQRDFYQMFAYFNNVPEKGKAIKYGNSPPYIKAPTPEQDKHLRLLHAQLVAAEKTWATLQPDLNVAQTAWETSARGKGPNPWIYSKGLQSEFLTTRLLMPIERLVITDSPATYLANVDIPFPNDAELKGHAKVGDFGFFDRFTIAAWVLVGPKGGPIVSRMAGEDRGEGYQLSVKEGHVHVDLVKRWLDDSIRVGSIETIEPKKWQHVAFSYDGSRQAAGVKIFINGRLAKLKVNLDDLNQSFATKNPFRLGSGGATMLHGALDDIRVYGHVLAAADVAQLAILGSIPEILAVPATKRSSEQKHKLRSYYLEKITAEPILASLRTFEKARAELDAFDATIPTTMVMEEMPTPRATHLLLRGEYDKPGPRVLPGLPEAFGNLGKGEPSNRLGLARWLVSRDHPLTARVAVNRYWQMLFGTGLVKSVEDFGAQGDWPSHPELLDWLACEFKDPTQVNCCELEKPLPAAWSVKALLKTIVTSATYRQSTRVTSEMLKLDPENRLLARGPRVRLPAEMIRDQALFVSGQLVEKIGGPSVKPYQPAGLVKELHGTDDDVRDHGPNLYRRSLYVHWKRTVAPPGLTTFDAANRETCVVRETRTNTPLQALHLLNDIAYVEAARVLAARVMAEANTPEARIAVMFRRATSRSPSPDETRILEASMTTHHRHYLAHRAEATKLTSVGESARPTNLDVAEWAAYTALANTILNLDEVITKE